ncbi:DUF1642 domain-containing protein [Enterococcus hirae]|uniref:DUF1642 domain-containing protein n=1 Tax=Enterococcus hirae TaxID=1354 RepID=UPI0021640504|nr:DUF1642 domain-containing protein [Enterococcus hirae]
MNKKELIDELTKYVERYEDATDEYDQGKSSAYEVALKLAKKLGLDEPQKPVVPKFVAEWFENNKDALDLAIFMAIRELDDNQKIVLEWLKSNRNSLKVPMLAFYELAELADENTNLAYHQLDSKQEIEVLAAFAQWGLGQEEAE